MMNMSSNSRRLQNRNNPPVLRSLSSSCASNPNPIQNPVILMHSSMDSVFAKMSSATQSLMETDDIDTSTQLVKLIKECADCVLSLKNASVVHQWLFEQRISIYLYLSLCSVFTHTDQSIKKPGIKINYLLVSTILTFWLEWKSKFLCRP